MPPWIPWGSLWLPFEIYCRFGHVSALAHGDISKQDRNRCLYKCLYIEAFDHQIAQLPWNVTDISNCQVRIIIRITKRICIFVSRCLAIMKIRSLATLNGVCVFQVNVVDQLCPGIQKTWPCHSAFIECYCGHLKGPVSFL